MEVEFKVEDKTDLAAVKAPVNERLVEPFLLFAQFIELNVVPYSSTELNEKFKNIQRFMHLFSFSFT